jgi:hypothetical protein
VTDILTLGMQADDLRRRLFGTTVTYSRVQVIASAAQPLPDISDAAAEVRVLELPQTVAEAVAAVDTLRRKAADRLLSAFSFSALAARAQQDWPSMADLLATLHAAGADDLAELPVDQIDDLDGALRMVRDAGLRGTRVTMMQAAGERAEEYLARVRAATGVRRFAPLPRAVAIDKPTTGYEDVRMVALARLALSGERAPVSIEVDWSLYGPKLAQVALLFGADHLDAVSPTSDASLGRRRETVEDVERNIRAAGFVAEEEPRPRHAPSPNRAPGIDTP